MSTFKWSCGNDKKTPLSHEKLYIVWNLQPKYQSVFGSCINIRHFLEYQIDMFSYVCIKIAISTQKNIVIAVSKLWQILLSFHSNQLLSQDRNVFFFWKVMKSFTFVSWKKNTNVSPPIDVLINFLKFSTTFFLSYFW